MSDAHTPVSRLDLTGMNREQAKEMIGKVIDKRLEEISHIELNEWKIDPREREKERAKAAERISERRNKRKHHPEEQQTIITELGVYSNYKTDAVLDVIQAEEPPPKELRDDPLEGQLSILDSIAARAKDASDGAALEAEEKQDAVPPDKSADAVSDKPAGFDFFGLLQYDPDREGFTEEEAGKLAEIRISTAIDEAVDKVFAFYHHEKERLLRLCGKLRGKVCAILGERIRPAVSGVLRYASDRLAPIFRNVEARLHLRDKTAAVIAVLAKGEKKASRKMVLFVDFLDSRNEKLIHQLVVLKEWFLQRIDQIRDYAEHHKKKLLAGFGVAVAAAAAVTIIIGNMTAYEYIYNGRVLGVVKNQEDVYKIIDVIGDKLSAQYEANITIDKDKDIRFKKIVAFHQALDDKDDILNRLTYMKDMKATGRGIYVDGKLVATLESDETARDVLEKIQNTYVKKDDNTQYKKIGFAQKVQIKDVETKLGNIETEDKALEYLMTGAVAKQIHTVKQGETFSGIAKMYGLKQSELRASNPDVIPEKLKIGQEICLNQIVPLLTVQTTEVAQYKEAIPFEIQYENTANLYKKEQTVKSKGSDGEKEVVAEVIRNNGIEVGRKELSATVLTQPVAQVVLVGTKEPPALIGTGNFIYPIRGRLTSRFGYRWGRLHSGIDLAAPIGTYIQAADGGLVTFAGYNGSLGYMVAIDHGGGRVTWYGHCSKLLVQKGDRVFQGQHIARVGNTGHSTGPHVHFEVHINGVAKNPLNYL